MTFWSLDNSPCQNSKNHWYFSFDSKQRVISSPQPSVIFTESWNIRDFCCFGMVCSPDSRKSSFQHSDIPQLLRNMNCLEIWPRASSVWYYGILRYLGQRPPYWHLPRPVSRKVMIIYESSHNYTLSVCPEKSMKELHATLVTHYSGSTKIQFLLWFYWVHYTYILKVFPLITSDTQDVVKGNCASNTSENSLSAVIFLIYNKFSLLLHIAFVNASCFETNVLERRGNNMSGVCCSGRFKASTLILFLIL
jgi:hypothetical protein